MRADQQLQVDVIEGMRSSPELASEKSRASDTAIAHEAIHALLWDIQIPEHTVKVAVDDGWVDLIGEVEWEYQRHAAEAAVRKLKTVKGVNNLITLKPKGPLARRTLNVYDSPAAGSLAHSSFTPKPAA